jgi:release factor glutamine methyltransferase
MSTASPHSLTYTQAVSQIKQRLQGLTETPGLDASVLLADITGKSKAHILAHPEDNLSEAQSGVLTAALDELKNGTPLPYVLGEWEFYGLPYKLTQDVLIPRPETELLVETALDWLEKHPHRQRVIEVGIGSGCISIALAVNCPGIDIIASDISPTALKVAEVNANIHRVNDRIKFLENNLLSNLSDPFDLILANLPYIPTQLLRDLPIYMKEPTLALDGGPDGLGLIRGLLAQAPPLLNPGGMVLLEIEAGQGQKSMELARKAFPDAHVTLKRDLAGHHRLVTIETP